MENLKCKDCGRIVHVYPGCGVASCPDCDSLSLRNLEGEWNSDLSRVKAGDLIASNRKGWIKVTKINDSRYPVATNIGYFTIDGRHMDNDISPSAFIVPPAYLLDIIGPKPEEAKCAVCGKELVRGENEIFDIDDITMCASCSRTVKKYHEVKNCSPEKPSESSKVVGYDDNGVPLHVDDDVFVWDYCESDKQIRKYKTSAESDQGWKHICYAQGKSKLTATDEDILAWRHAAKAEDC